MVFDQWSRNYFYGFVKDNEKSEAIVIRLKLIFQGSIPPFEMLYRSMSFNRLKSVALTAFLPSDGPLHSAISPLFLPPRLTNRKSTRSHFCRANYHQEAVIVAG